MRLLLFFILVLGFNPLFGQTVKKGNSMAGPEFSLMKYSISFADQSQIAYDGSDLSKSGFVKFMPPSIAEAGDVDYYMGHYGNAIGLYFNVVGSLPMKNSSSGGLSLYKNVMNRVDYEILSEEEAKLYTGITNAVGMLYHTRGKFVYADSMLNRALKVRSKRFGRTSREYINSLCNVAVLKKDVGSYDEAEKMFNYLERTIPKLYGKNSMQYVITINNKAMLLAELGRTKAAIALLDEALAIGKEVLSDSYIDYDRILTNRALIEQESGSLEKASLIYQEILDSMERKEFDDHPDYNNVLVYYGALRIQLNDKDVLQFLEQSSNKVRKRYGDAHPLMAKALTNLGEYHLVNNSFAEARLFFQQAADIQLKLLGERHKDYLASLIKIGICDWHMNVIPQASLNFKKAIENYLFLLDSFFPTMSESEKTKFWGTLKPSIDTFMSFAASTGEQNPVVLVDAYNLHLRTKGILFNATSQTRNTILSSSDSVVNSMYQEWLGMKITLANYYSAPLEDLKEDKIDLKALEAEANQVEKELASRSSAFESTYKNASSSYADVINSLGEGEAAVEIIRVNFPYGPQRGKTEYIGLLAKPKEKSPQLVTIEDGLNLEKRALSFYKNSVQARVEESMSFDTFWAPFQSELEGYDKIYVSVDGVYNSININTLKRGDGNYMIDDENIVLLPSTRLIGEVEETQVTLTSDDAFAALIGSPDYGAEGTINPLPGTKVEVEKIEALLQGKHVKTKVMTEQSASEENLKELSPPSVLHIATHGYFLSDVSTDKGMTMGVSISRAKENPLLRSGLLFSGAELSISAEPSLQGGDNGILNAYEAMNLNLHNTKLVIMSACETGTGEIVNGEGVYGLSRSFQIAGAKKIIMSLWKVDDNATQELMSAFYESWIETNNPQEAFLLAQRAVKKKFNDPYYWGAFVLLN